jgi:hypothetical protein
MTRGFVRGGEGRAVIVDYSDTGHVEFASGLQSGLALRWGKCDPEQGRESCSGMPRCTPDRLDGSVSTGKG